MYHRAAAAIRGLSWTPAIAEKLVQEGALEPLVRLLASRDNDILADVAGALNNLTQGEANKAEIVKAGAVAPLLRLMHSDDMAISAQTSAALARSSSLPLPRLRCRPFKRKALQA